MLAFLFLLPVVLPALFIINVCKLSVIDAKLISFRFIYNNDDIVSESEPVKIKQEVPDFEEHIEVRHTVQERSSSINPFVLESLNICFIMVYIGKCYKILGFQIFKSFKSYFTYTAFTVNFVVIS